MLAPAVVVREADLAPPGFDARRSARSRSYRYVVLVAPAPDPLLAHVTWHVRDDLDMRTMAAAADSLLGEHDFAAFCRRPPGTAPGQPIPRRVLDARWSLVPSVPWLAQEFAQRVGEESGESPPGPRGGARSTQLLQFDIRAQSFCHQMVRSIVGALVDVGRARRRASDVTWLLQSGDRSRANTVAPPQGLCLMGVEYGSEA